MFRNICKNETLRLLGIPPKLLVFSHAILGNLQDPSHPLRRRSSANTARAKSSKGMGFAKTAEKPSGPSGLSGVFHVM